MTRDSDLVATELHGAARIAARPERIGPYHLLDLLGEGGMGTVYLAEQCEPLPRRVALKLMRWGDAEGQAIRRFELEREAMARMSHPAIAQVYDAGTTEHGQPYVVLEHIPGLPITTYCDRHRLGLRQRLALLATVCDGVRHAHEKGVIHRDLKPSNILVTDGVHGPAPKIIDFGIAKALEPWSPASGSATASRSRLGSPGYMSPEAILDGSRAIDTRSDVYSLGVVLCELLIGVRPFPTRRTTVRQIRDATDDPQLPSQRWRALPADQRRAIAAARGLDEARLLRSLRSELDWVVLRAIATDPDHRYRSASDLASDIQRWAAGRLVEARPPSLAYRAAKTLQRHAAAFAIVGAIMVTFAAFAVHSRILHTRAEAARVQAEALVGFMLDDLTTRLEPLGHLDLLEAVSRESLSYFESLSAADLERADGRPAAALRQIGEVLHARGDLSAALDAFDRASVIDRRRHAARPDAVAPRIALARDLLAASDVLEARGELAAAETRTGEAETLLRDLVATTPNQPAARLALARLLSRQRPALSRNRGDVDGATAAYREARAITEALVADRPDDPELRHLLGDIHYGTGLLALYERGDAATAIERFTAGATVYRELAERYPEAPGWRYRLAVLSGQGLATTYGALDRPAEAEAANATALALLEQLVREEPGQTRWAHAFGWELVRQGMFAHDRGDLARAAASYRRAAEVQETVIARTRGDHSSWLDGLAVAYEALADVSTETGDLAAAREASETALAVRRRMHPPGSEDADIVFQPRFAVNAVGLAELRWLAGDAQGAAELLDEAGAIVERLAATPLESSDMRLDLAVACVDRGELLRALGRANDADRALAGCRDLVLPDDAGTDPRVVELRQRFASG